MKKVYKASSPGCSRVLENVLDKYSSRTKSAVSRLLMLVCFAVLGLSASVSAQCPGGSCSITCPPDISLCLAPDNYGHSEITSAWVASFANPSGPSSCTQKRVWRDPNGNVELEAGQSIWVDCDDVGDHIDLWVTVEKPLWIECRSSFVRVRVHIKDCEPPAVACPPMGMFVCNDDVPRPGTSIYIPFAGWFKKISLATFQNLGGSATDACGIDFVVYRDQETVDPVCKTNRTIDREFWVFDVNGNHRHCNQMLVVADNVPPTFVENPADLEIACDASDAAKIAAITDWLNKNRHPGNQAGQDAVVQDNCDENMVMITAAPGTTAAILAQMPNACDPNPREVIVVFTANDGCGNAATRSAKVRFVDNVEPTVPPIQNSFYECASQVPALPNIGVVIDARDNCTPTNKLTIAFDREVRTDNGCPDKFTLVRYYLITDCDGNVKERNHTIIVNDDVDPYWNPGPKPLFLMNVCNPSDLTTQIQGWMNDNGGGTPLDNCGTPTVSVDKTAADVAAYLRRFCDSPGNNTRSTTVTFTARDACGNTRTATATVRLMDTEPPTGTPPAYAKYDCADDVPQMLTNQVIFLSDNCHDGNSVKVEIEANPPAMPGCEHYPYFLTRKWRLTDCAGNTSIVSQTIRVADETAPQWTTFPDGIDLNCTDGALNTKLNDWLTNIGGGVALDQCSGSNLTYSADNFHNSVNKILDRLGPCAPKAGSTTVTFYAKDECGNSVSRQVVVNVRDNTPPTATSVTSQFSCLSQVPSVNPAVITDEYDSCSPNPPSVVFLSQSDNGGAGCMASPLVITRWYKLTDCSSNTASVSHRITVIDMIAPQALCKAQDRNLGANGTVTVPATAFDDGSTDNCMIDKIQISRTNGGPWFESITYDCADIPDIPNCGANVQNTGIVTVYFRVLDKCGNVDYCTTTITLHDVTPPVVTCPNDMTIYTDNNGGYDCKSAATWTHPAPTDNCSVKCMEMEVQKEINGVFVTINPNNGAQSPNYVTQVIAQAGQPAGPYLFGKGPYCDDNQYKVIYRVRDEHGNNKPGVMCMFVITVKDNEVPKWNDCPTAPIVAQTVTNDCYQMKCYKRPTAYDNCEYPGGPCPAPTVVVTVSDPTVMINQVGDEDCALFPVGRTVVTYTATDAEGNTSTCTVEVLISDLEDPMAMCVGNFTVNLEPDGDIQLQYSDIDAGSTDNCGLCAKEISLDNINYGPNVVLDCDDVNTWVTVWLRVKDCSTPANMDRCTTKVYVEDMQSPGIAYCPADISVGTDDDVCEAVVVYTPPTFNDGCGSAHPGVLTLGYASGSVFPIGVTHVQYKYVSLSGYTVYCDFNVTVEDDEAPSITCPANVMNLTCLQILPAPMTAAQMIAANLLKDNCGVTALDFSDYDNDLTHCAYDGLRTIIRTYTAWDAAGNSATCTQTFRYVEDVTPPVLAMKPADVSFQCADDIPPVPVQSATDNCGDVVIDFSEEVQPNGCENKLVVIRYWVASDACGNTATWRQTITVDDTTPPELYAKPLRRHYACADDVEIAPYQFATDNCDVAFVEFSETTDPGECHNKFTIERRWVAYDLCGNSSTWEQIISVNDSIPPVLSATPVDRTYECAEQVEAAPVQVATDNCGVVTLNFEETTNPGSCPNQYEIYRRWYAYDLCGNTAEHWQTITVHDNVPPVLLTTPVDRTYECADDVPAAPVGNATDNCDIVFVDFSESIINGDCHNKFTVVRRWLATDLCGNTDEHWQHITVYDGKAPTFDQTVPPAVVDVDCAQEVPAAAVLTATDNCDGSVVVIYSEELVPGDCDDKFSIIRTWTAEDLCGNLLRYTQRINVFDDKAPVWNQPAPPNPLVECSENVPPVPVQTATDNCVNPVTMDFSEVTVPGTCPNQYMVVRTWVAMDACGNATTRVQTVTVSDTKAPVWTSPAPAAFLSYQCAEEVLPPPVQTATDNCTQPLDMEYYEVLDPGTCPNSFIITRVWTAEDDCGNSTSRQQVISVQDTQAPVWDQPAPASPVNVECSEQVPVVPVQTATDNCGVPVDINFNEVINWGTCSNQFQVVRTWTAADDCGNITTRVQVINISDTKAPTWNQPAPASPVNVECSEQVPAVPVQTASDNCAAPIYIDFSEIVSPGTCPNQFSVTRTWIAMDDCGNVTTRVQVINVNDVKAPVMSGLPAATVNVECSEQVPVVPVVTVTDNCAAPIVLDFSEVEIPGTCPNQYVITRTWRAQDDCGNSTFFVQTITISDTKAPVFAGLPAATVNVECSEQVPALANVTATDNCNAPVDVEISEIEIPGTCPNQYVIKRTWTAEDDCGNSTVFTQTITISDTKAPVMSGLPVATVNVECSEQVPAVPVVTVTDNCAAPIVLDFSEVEIPGTCPNQYVIKRTWSAQDDCGNATSFVQTITISDTKAPVFAGLPVATVNVECSEQVPALAVVTATDNCAAPVDVEISEIEIPGTCPNQYVIKRTWTAEDDCGNSTVFTQTITISDTKAPVFGPLPAATVNVECSEQVPALAVVTATDNCAAPVDVEISEIEIPGTCPNQYSITRTWTAEDDCGNITTFVQTINVSDTKAPTWDQAAPATPVNVECSEQVPPVPVQTATDNCIKPIFVDFSEVIVPGTCPNQFSLTRTWIAQDDCGNATTRVQVINVSDTKAPVLAGLPAAVVNVSCSENVPALANVTATDNCAAPVDVEISEIEIPGTCPNQYSITRTWTAEDDCGNITSFVQTINISDTEAPTWNSATPVVWINEIHYDNVGTDANEFVEVAGTAGTNLSNYSIVLYNGANGLVYDVMNLSGFMDNESNGHGARSFAYPVNGVQNGSPDGLALVLNGTMVLQFLSYEGAFLAVDGPAAGMMSTDIGVSEDGSNPVGTSLSLTGSGNNYGAFTWNPPATATPGSKNTGQSFTPAAGLTLPTNMAVQCGENVPMPVVLTASDNCNAPVDVEFNEVFLPGSGPNDGVTITRTWTAEDDCGNAIVHTQVITVNDSQAPVLVGTPAATVAVSCSENVPAVAAVTVLDNCQGTVDLDFNEVEVPGTCPNQYSVVRTWSATDFAGNTAVFTQTITINDTQAPVFSQVPTTPLNVKCAADVPAAPAITASDNCNAPVFVDFSETVTPGNCLNKFTLVRTWVAQDDCGNGTSIQQVINVNDDVAPVISCPAPLMAQCSPAEQPPYANLAEFETAGGTASDNCGLNVNSFGMISEVKNGNVYTRTYRVVDQCGNAGTCTQTVTVMDTQPPVFLNCPVGPLVFGNDPDKCSAKINWPAPVAVDNCSIPTVVQTAGPTAGSIVPVGNYTVSFTATDAMGNTKVCSFQVMVMDTQNPEFDADIVMPANVTVECNAVPAPFVLTTDDVHDNCTPSNLLVITFTEVRTNGNCKFNYTLTRTWKVTDQAGNMLVHTQIVTVRDTKAPTAICKNATVTLDKFGNATVTAAAVNNGSFDNCSAQADLTLTVTPSAFTCANLGANVVTLRVTDECGNSATCTAIVTVLEGPGPCTPQYAVLTTCMATNGNATTLENGQFRDRITIKSLAMQTWTLQSSTGFYSTTSPAPPGAPVALANGTTFTAGTADGIDNDGDGQTDEADEMVYYTLSGVHVECIGYSITVGNNLGQTGTISNKACYPTPYFTNLNDPFCLSTPPFTIGVAETNGATGNVINVMVNGVPTTIFNAATLGIGFHTVMATFDAGTATTNLVINGVQVGGTMAQALADPGCQQKITKIVQITNTPTTIVCNDLVNVSLHNDGGDCVFVIAPDDVLEGSYLCDDDYSVVLTYPFGTHTFSPANRVDYTHIGKTLNYNLVHAISGNVCWGKIKVEDKEPPVLTCPSNITIKCSDPTNASFTGQLLVSDCDTWTTVDTDDFTDFGTCSNPRAQIIRTWLVTDKTGNQSTCSQTITISPFNLADVKFPADVTLNCANANSTDPNATGVPTINGSPIGTGGLCMASISKTDEYYDICPGSYEIVRTWKVRNMCLPVGPGNPVEHVQVIKTIDTQGPVFDCPTNFVVSTDPFTCCATADLPDLIITEGCSNVASLTYKVTGIDITTGNLVLIEGTGYLSDFPGNNHWNPDTMAVFGFTSCLPLGDYTVTYTAVDGCGNVSNCSFTMTVEDQIPPIAACDEFTQVALGVDGMAFINAHTFDDGSYDVCYDVHFKARRMNDNDCQDADFFYDQVKFCCDDINDTILVVFRVYDVPVPSGAIGLDDYDGHYNDCMVRVFVEDKIKPLCNAPANVTVSCENFDPSLWAYGFATSGDNCCVDTITTTVSYSLFDTLCSKGTITRTFRAFDCGGLSSQCTQRVFVNYEQDYFVKFPNDVIVTVCDGMGNYGEPTFFGEDCELLGVSHEDEVFTVVPDACFKIERTWTIINWCTYNPNAGCINVPNPNPNATSNHPSNLPGPTVSALGTPAPWNPTVVAILPGQTPTNYSTFWDANANCYKYKQIIKIIDSQKPEVTNCPTSPVEFCDITPNNNQLWNESYWYDNATTKHDLCEAPTDLTITATDLCSGASVNIRYLLFLDLDNSGDMETVISSTNLPGFNNVQFGNAFNPNFGGGTSRAFDERPVLSNQKYGFALQTTVSGTNKTGSVRWNTQQQPSNYVVPELPYGTHKIKWIVEDGCGNETVCEYTFVVKDCKKPTVVCLNGLSVNIMPTQMIQLWANDFLQYTEDNCTPSDKLVIGIRRSGTGTGFPTNPDGTPQTSVTFTCNELGTQLVELWSMDLAGNADYCETYVIVQDPNNFCSNAFGTVAGVLKTEADQGLEDANVELDGSSPALPPTSMFEFTKQNGSYLFAGVPFLGDYTVTPTKDNDPLNGVSTFDLVLINKHILGLAPLNSPYKMIAADANNSRSITTFDIVELRKLILGIYTELPNNTSWRFVDSGFNFPNQQNPFETIFPETKQIADMQASMAAENFVSVKVGDVNQNAVTSSLYNTEDRTEGTLMFDVQDRTVKAGETVTLNFRAAERNLGYQFTMNFPNLEVVDVVPGAEMTMSNFGIFNSNHSLTTSFDNENIVGEFAITFRAKAAGTLSQMLSVSSQITKAEAYDLNQNRQSVALRFNGNNGTTVTGLGFELYQNQPNPWTNKTQIGFYLPQATEATLTIFDESGRTVFTQTGDFSKGYNAFAIERALVNTTGVLFYKLETTTDSAVKKMIQTK